MEACRSLSRLDKRVSLHGEDDEFEVQRTSIDATSLLRILHRDSCNQERASAWVRAENGATLLLGGVAAQKEGEGAILLDGGDGPAVLPSYTCPLAPAFGSLSASNTSCINPYSGRAVLPAANAGCTIVPLILGAGTNTTEKIGNVAVSWIDASGNTVR